MAKHLIVVGDTLLDVDLVGTVSRVCPDAPVPVVDLEHRTRRAGGAGLTATLAAADGLSVTLVTAVADDEAGRILRAELGDLDTVVGPARAATPVKTRLRGAGQSIARIDEGGGGAPPAVTDEMLDAVCAADAVLVSDYGRGITADERLRALLSHLATQKPVIWDPHPRGSTPVPNTTLVCPNQDEALSFAESFADRGDAVAAASALRDRWSVGAVAVTMGAAGALLDDGTSSRTFPAPQVAVADPCGAGDRFAAAAAGALMSGDPVEAAVRTAVSAAARFLADGGVASLSPRNVRPLVPPQGRAQEIAEAVRSRGGTVVATGGCFDLLHAGHVHTLAAARELGDCLIVCLNSDRSVRRLKGVGRPINTEADRVDVLTSLSCVDAVVVFDEDTPEAILNELRPHIWVKGGDYTSADALPENRLLRVWGGRTVLVPEHPGRSTTRLATALRRVG
jgi:rfaE bifunctional protein nucleotidyltransferase chain/domain/rfaE bifunctional protein kinase chain/domain